MVCPQGQATSPPWRRLFLTLSEDQTHITITDPEMWDVAETGFSLAVFLPAGAGTQPSGHITPWSSHLAVVCVRLFLCLVIKTFIWPSQ